MDFEISVESDSESLTSDRESYSFSPRLLTVSAGSKECCIFPTPPCFNDAQSITYEPEVVSIGPYHRGKANLRMFQEHKTIYLIGMLKRFQSSKLTRAGLKAAISRVESRARECYSQAIDLNSQDFVNMMVLDGCFVLELFRKGCEDGGFADNDPIYTMSWVQPSLARDFLKLENQIPYFILQSLYHLTTERHRKTVALSSRALKFFSRFMMIPKDAGSINLEDCHHLLDVVRRAHIDVLTMGVKEKPIHAVIRFFKQLLDGVEDSSSARKEKDGFHLTRAISKLRKLNISVKHTPDDDRFLAVRFKHGSLLLAELTIDDFARPFFFNAIVYEQCKRGASSHFTAYAVLLDCLVNTAQDVERLCERNVLRNNLGSDKEAAQFIRQLGKLVRCYPHTFYITDVFKDIESHYLNKWLVGRAWGSISALAAAILLAVASQTFYTHYGV